MLRDDLLRETPSSRHSDGDLVPSTVVVARGRQAVTDEELGRDVYNYRCYFCHGYNGDAKTVASSYLSPPPRDFSATSVNALTRQDMLDVVMNGSPNSAMMAFDTVLSDKEITAVVGFIRHSFMGDQVVNTRYHTEANGWPQHERFISAFPFATGAIPLDTPWDDLNESQANGRRLFMSSCVTCHDRAAVSKDPTVLNRRSISFPRGGYNHKVAQTTEIDAISGASPYADHDEPPEGAELNAQELLGETLFQSNCAFCHAADGSGKNWIGSFLQPHPRNLTGLEAQVTMTQERLKQVIRNGLPGTSMSAWKDVLNDEEIDAIVAYVMKVFVKNDD